MPSDDSLLQPSSPGVEVDSRLLTGANAALILGVSVAPLLSECNAAPIASYLRRTLPLLGRGLGALLWSAAASCEAARVGCEQLFVLAHGGLTYACGDVIAQTAVAAAEARRRPAAAQRRRLRWRPARTARAAAVGVLSDTLPFYHWSSRLMALDASSFGPWLRDLLLRSPALLLPLKIGVHVLVFQPLSTAAYLLLQGGEALLRRRFVAAFLPAFGSFVVGGALVYSLPSVALQAALRNAGVLAICVYMAWLASEPPEEE